MALCKGVIYTWGHGDNGRLGNGDKRGTLLPLLNEYLSTRGVVVYIAAGEAHSAAITDSGALFTFGDGSFGRLGHGEEEDELKPRQVDMLAQLPIRQVDCGAFHTLAVEKAKRGTLWAFGAGLYGKLGLGDEGNRSVPHRVPLPVTKDKDVHCVQVACGTFHSMAGWWWWWWWWRLFIEFQQMFTLLIYLFPHPLCTNSLCSPPHPPNETRLF